ncbi:MAG: hypothetical protein QM820_33020 [Minicystis sp.]
MKSVPGRGFEPLALGDGLAPRLEAARLHVGEAAVEERLRRGDVLRGGAGRNHKEAGDTTEGQPSGRKRSFHGRAQSRPRMGTLGGTGGAGFAAALAGAAGTVFAGTARARDDGGMFGGGAVLVAGDAPAGGDTLAPGSGCTVTAVLAGASGVVETGFTSGSGAVCATPDRGWFASRSAHHPAAPSTPITITIETTAITARLLPPSDAAPGACVTVTPAAVALAPGAVTAALGAAFVISPTGTLALLDTAPASIASARPRARTVSLAVRKRAAGSVAVTRANHPSNAAGSVTPRRRARVVAGSSGPRTAVMAKAITSPALAASGAQ